MHIVCATLVFTSWAYSFSLWKKWQQSGHLSFLNQILSQTLLIIIPFATLQLLTGFVLLSLNHESLTQTWIVGSFTGFMMAVVSWISFVFSLFLPKNLFLSRFQAVMLIICTISSLSMVFFMANKSV